MKSSPGTVVIEGKKAYWMSEREKTESGRITSDENSTETGVKHEKNITGSCGHGLSCYRGRK